jgi:hypothetical protein
MKTTGIYNINKQLILKRFYKRGYHELSNYLFYLTEIPSEETVEQFKNEVFLKKDILDISGEGLEVIHQFFVEDSLNSYCAWIKNEIHLFYISISLQTKKWGEVVIKKTSLKPKFFDEIEVIDKDFIKAKSEVFYLGKKIDGADASSFQKTICDTFYEDENRVYSFSNFRINILEKQPDIKYFFIPYCDCFASEHTIYRLDNWTDKIIQVSGDFTGSIFNQHLEKIISQLYPELSENECIFLREKLGVLKNYENIFQTIFPDTDAKWSKTN